MKALSNLSFALVLLFILFSCGKKNIDKPLTDTSSGNKVSKNTVIAPEPPAIVPEDITVAEQNGESIGIISEVEYNSLGYKDQVFYTGLRNSIVYLFDDPTNERMLFTFNIDGSYTIVGNPDEEDDDPDADLNCVQCHDTVKTAIANCMKHVAKYMEDNNKTEVTVKIKVISSSTPGKKCVVVNYKYPNIGDPDPTGGSVLETFTPSAPPSFTNAQFDSFIQSTTLWYGSAHPPVPVVWDALSLNAAIDAFILEELSPAYDVYAFASQQGFVPAVKAYVSAHY